MPRSLWLFLLLLAACGGGDPTGTVTVETGRVCCLDAPSPIGTPVAGVAVIAEDPDGTTRTAVSGADGVVTIEVADGGSITAVYRYDGQVAYLYSFLDVSPGDHLRFGDGENDQSVAFPPTASMRVDFPDIPEATGYKVVSSCGWSYVDHPLTQASFDQTAACAPDQDDLYFYAYRNGTVIDHGVLRDVTFAAGGEVALDAWAPATDLALDVTGLPLDASDATLAVTGIGRGGALDSAFFEGAPAAGSFAHSFPWTPDGDAVVGSAIASTPAGVQVRATRFAADASTATIADPIGLPWISGRAFDVANGTLSYQLDAEQDGDFTVGYISYATTSFPSVYWRLYAPPSHAGANQLVLPATPEGFEDVDPVTSVTADGWLELRDLDSVDGYDAARTSPIWQLEMDLFTEGGRTSQPGA